MISFEYSKYFGKDAGFISSSLFKIPIRSFLPQGLHQSSCKAKNLWVLGCKNPEISSGSIGFTFEDSLYGTIGEYVERYSAGIYNIDRFVFGNYNELIEIGFELIPPSIIRPYASWQLKDKNFEYAEFTDGDPTHWEHGINLITGKKILVPAFLVYLPYQWPKKEKQFIQNTSTGLSAHSSLDSAILSGFFECAERHTFTQFWYKQKEIDFISYSPQLIVESFSNNPKILKLFNNSKVKMRIFDLTHISKIETVVVVLFFEYKKKIYQTIGAASRFSKEQALVKAALEAYQGVDYVLSLKDKLTIDTGSRCDVDTYEKHAMFYNFFPELREKVPIFKEALSPIPTHNIIVNDSEKIKSLSAEELSKLQLRYLMVHTITSEDVKSLGFEVVRICIPEWSLLTGKHNAPFLGSNVFDNYDNLFLELPHPFP